MRRTLVFNSKVKLLLRKVTIVLGVVLCFFGGASMTWASNLIYVEGGTFVMQDFDHRGQPFGNVRETTVSSFRIGKYPVTLGEWEGVRRWAIDNGYNDQLLGLREGCGENYPIRSIWYSAITWCNARSEMEGLDPIYYVENEKEQVYRGSREHDPLGWYEASNIQVRWDADGYRLPTEAEWEFAARGGNRSKGFTYSGSNYPDAVAWYRGNYEESKHKRSQCQIITHPVGKKMPNELGLYDMSGNVNEMVWDWYAPFELSKVIDPKGPSTGTYKVVKGGDSTSFSVRLNPEMRMLTTPAAGGGFRVVRRFKESE